MKPSLLALTVMLALTSISAAYASDAPNFSALLEQSRAQSPSFRKRGSTQLPLRAKPAKRERYVTPPLMPSQRISTLPSNGASQRQTTYTISQPLEIFGQRGARIQAGEKGCRRPKLASTRHKSNSPQPWLLPTRLPRLG